MMKLLACIAALFALTTTVSAIPSKPRNRAISETGYHWAYTTWSPPGSWSEPWSVYQVALKYDTTGQLNWSTWNTKGGIAPGSEFYNFTGLERGRRLQARMRTIFVGTDGSKSYSGFGYTKRRATKIDNPGAPEGVACAADDATTVTCTWNINTSGDRADEWVWEYRTDPGSWANIYPIVVELAGTYTTTFSGLAPGAGYKFRVKGRNFNGSSSWITRGLTLAAGTPPSGVPDADIWWTSDNTDYYANANYWSGGAVPTNVQKAAIDRRDNGLGVDDLTVYVADSSVPTADVLVNAHKLHVLDGGVLTVNELQLDGGKLILDSTVNLGSSWSITAGGNWTVSSGTGSWSFTTTA